MAASILWLAVRRPERRRAAVAVASLAGAGVVGYVLLVAVPASALGEPGIAIFPTTLTFGTQTVGTTTIAQKVFVTNTGADALSISGISTSGDFLQTNDCGSSLDPGASCAISVGFAPTSSGARTGTLQIVDGAVGSPRTLTLSGTGGDVPNTGTPTGTFSVGVGGVSGTLLNTAVVTLTVQ